MHDLETGEVLPLTSEEKKWLKKLQNVLNECPSNRMEAYTIGDAFITIFDVSAYNSEEAKRDNCDWCHVVSATNTELANINFPFAVAATAG